MPDPVPRRPVQVALYWDYENVHSVLKPGGPGGAGAKQETEVTAVLTYAATLGEICVNRAYANWVQLAKHGEVLGRQSTELVQLFPRGGQSKNSADMQLCVDVMEDLFLKPHIGIYIIVSGDSDYIGVARKVRSLGKRVIGIGVRGRTSLLWAEVCHVFKFYDELLPADRLRPVRVPAAASPPQLRPPALPTPQPQTAKAKKKPAAAPSAKSAARKAAPKPTPASKPPAKPAPSAAALKEAKRLLVAAMTFLSKNGPEVHLSLLKQTMRKLQPGFDEKVLGFRTFHEFAARYPHAVAVRGKAGAVRVAVLLAAPDEGGFTLTAPLAAAAQPRQEAGQIPP